VIHLTRLNDTVFVVNTDLIEYMESTPDTVITLTTGKKLVVRESVDDIIERIVHYRRRLFHITYEKLTDGNEV